MRSAEQSKPPIARLFDKFAGQYLLLVLLIAAGTWFASGNLAACLAVLVASCPCALVLAAPATAIAAIAVAARHGILIKGAAFLENLAEIDTVIFDKTGTITTGRLTLLRAVPASGKDEANLRLVAASLGAVSQHPVSRAAAEIGTPVPVQEAREAGGLGVSGSIAGRPALLGRADLLRDKGVEIPPLPDHDGPLVLVAWGGACLGYLLFADTARAEASDALAELRGMGLARQTLLTGDRVSVARRIAADVGIEVIEAEALPEAKLRYVVASVARGERPMVVGDGINDSLALKAGAVGVAMGGQGSDVALASADLVLMTNDLRRLATCIRLSRRCRRTIQTNIVIGLGWTALLVIAAATGLLGAEGAILAALLHNVGTFAGLANSGRLLRFNEV
jgi:heavy metal translocating P-type ATPase